MNILIAQKANLNASNHRSRSRNGKIDHVRLGTIHVTLKKTLQYLLSKILQTRLPVVLVEVVCRQAKLPYQIIVSIVFSAPYSIFCCNFNILCT